MPGAGLDVLQEPRGIDLGHAHNALGRAGRRGGRAEGNVTRHPCRNHVGGVFGVRGARDQVIGIVECHKALGVFGGQKDGAGIVDADGFIPRRVQDQQRGFQVGNRRGQRGFRNVIDKGLADAEGATAQHDLG